MLHNLRIHNLALISTAHLDFGPGLSVLTGESGSGKSIILDALALVTGGSRPRVRAASGAASGLVEAEFVLARDESGEISQAELKRVLDEHGLLEACSGPDEPLICARRIDAAGRTRCFIQGQTVTRAVLSEVGGYLLELCGQSEAHNLRTPATQLLALDRFARLGRQQRQLARLVQDVKTQEAEVLRLEGAALEAERRRDFIEFQLNELKDVDLADLEEKRVRLDTLTEATSSLSSHEELREHLETSEQALVPQLRWLSARLGSRMRGDANGLLSAAISTLDSVTAELEDVARASSLVLADSSRDQEEAEQLRAEFSALFSLAQKHRIGVEALSERRAQLEAELATIASLNDELEEARTSATLSRAQAEEAAECLHAARIKAAQMLDRRMKKELTHVGLAQANFVTHMSRGTLSASGITQLEFAFSANPGHEPQALSRVASGGELSRVLLCFRLATDSSGAMLVFDEIDAGAGGKTAEKIAAALKRAGKNGQVLCVTHWPQVAGVADYQFSVSKGVSEGATRTSVELVAGEDRLREISRMLGGAEATAREHASGLVNGTPAAA